MSEDPHAEIKETYWDIKYREWRKFILTAPFLTFFIGLFVGVLIFFPRVMAQNRAIDGLTQDLAKNKQWVAEATTLINDYKSQIQTLKQALIDYKPQEAPTPAPERELTVKIDQTLYTAIPCRASYRYQIAAGMAYVVKTDGNAVLIKAGDSLSYASTPNIQGFRAFNLGAVMVFHCQ